MTSLIQASRFQHPCRRTRLGCCLLLALFAATSGAFAQTNAPTNSFALPSATAGLTNAGTSVLRVFGAFILVTAVFLAGVWLFRNWRRFTVAHHGQPRLQVFEAKSLGQRQAIYVVGYDQQRMLLASSPAGVAFLSHLPSAEETAAGSSSEPARTPTFAQAFQQILSRKP